MCSVCNCFAWSLDLFQRALTFCLSCWLAFTVCCGLGIAVIAGIAYGYNYCMAEFVTLARSDVRVYMRRGQFYDRPDLIQPKRRRGDDDDVFPYNLTEDYHQGVQTSDDATSNKWMKEQDIRRYAEKLIKYSEDRDTLIDMDDRSEPPKDNHLKFITPKRSPSASSNLINSTTTPQNDSSDVIIRMFEPVSKMSESELYEDDNTEAKVNKVLDKALAKTTDAKDKETDSMPPDIRIAIEDKPNSQLMRMRYWRTTSQPINLQYSADTDDNIIYKTI